MKILAAFLLVLLAGVSCSRWGPNGLECLEELNLSKEAIDEVYDPWRKRSPEYDVVLNEFLECSWKKAGTLNGIGVINWGKLHENLSKSMKENIKNSETGSEKVNVVFITKMIRTAYTSCRKQHIEGDTPGQTIVKTQNCVTDQLTNFKSSHQDQQ